MEDPNLLTDLAIVCGRLTRRVAREGNAPEVVSDWRSLAIIEQYGPVSVGGLARAYGCSQPAATKIVNRLEGKGAVVRVASETDARVIVVSLTDAGRERLAQVRETSRQSIAPLARDWTPEDEVAVRRTIELIRRLVDDAAQNER